MYLRPVLIGLKGYLGTSTSVWCPYFKCPHSQVIPHTAICGDVHGCTMLVSLSQTAFFCVVEKSFSTTTNKYRTIILNPVVASLQHAEYFAV